MAHLAGQLYRPIIAKQAQFSTQMSVSGPASCTGKSLMMSVGMLMFYGEQKPTTTSITESTFFEMLENGNLYGNMQLLCYIARLHLLHLSHYIHLYLWH